MDKKTVHSTINQLVNAYRLHLKASNQSPIQNSSALLLFYAVECGLKARYLGIKRLNSTEDLIRYFSSKKPYGHNHDINKWVKEIKLSAASIPIFIDNPLDPISGLHEKLRYGVNPSPHTFSRQLQFLKGLAAALQNQI